MTITRNMPRLTTRQIAALIVALLLAAGFAVFAYSAYRWAGSPLRFLRGAVVVPGNVTEKLEQTRSDRLLPFDIPAYVVRYAYLNPQGQMRTGEQIVTRRTFQQLDEQGAPAEIAILPDQPGASAFDPRLTFPSVAGWRLGIALGALAAAYFVFLFGVLPLKGS